MKPPRFLHHHPCQDCGFKTQCYGQVEQNYDGFPEWTCREFHLPNGETNADWVCEACEWRREDEALNRRAAQSAH